MSAPRAHRMDGVQTEGTILNPGQFLRGPVYDGKKIQCGITFADLEQPTGHDRWLTANVQDGLDELLVEEHGIPGAFSQVTGYSGFSGWPHTSPSDRFHFTPISLVS